MDFHVCNMFTMTYINMLWYNHLVSFMFAQLKYLLKTRLYSYLVLYHVCYKHISEKGLRHVKDISQKYTLYTPCEYLFSEYYIT